MDVDHPTLATKAASVCPRTIRRAAPLLAAFATWLVADRARADVLVYAADGDAFREDVRVHLTAANLPALGEIDVVDARSVVLTAELLAEYDAVLTWGNQVYENAIVSGDALADFSDGGGGVVVCAFATSDDALAGIAGRFVDGGYLATSKGERAPDAALTMVVDDGSHRIMDGVVALDGGADSGHNADLVPTAGAVVLASWSNGEPLVVAHEPVGRTVVVNLFPVSDDAWPAGWSVDTDGARLLANAVWWSMGAVCGDGFTEAPEACDDANADDGDACVACAVAVCGDGALEVGVEACDDGNDDDDDGCRNDCTIPDDGPSEGEDGEGSGGGSEGHGGDSSGGGSDTEAGDGPDSSTPTSDATSDAGADDGASEATAEVDPAGDGDDPAGCGCTGGQLGASWWWLGVLAWHPRRRARR